MLTNMLLEASGAGSFFAGSGNYEDEYPYLELTEATAAIPAMIMETMSEGIDLTAAESEHRLSAIMESAAYNTELDTDALVESGWDTIKRKIKNLFERLKKFIKSVIAKITNYLDSFTKSGAQLASKYGDEIKKRAGTGAYSSLTFNGYTYIDNIGGAFMNESDSFKSIDGLNKIIQLGDSGIVSINDYKGYVNGLTKDSPSELPENAKNAKKKIDDLESNKLKKAVIEKVAGVSSIGEGAGEWKKALMKKLQNDSSEKKEIKYGSAPFTIDSLLGFFNNTNRKDWNDVKSDYASLETACNQQQRALEEIKVDKEDNTVGSGALSAYVDKYLDRISDCWAAMTLMRDCKVAALKAQNSQMRSMLAMLVRKGEKKKENSDVELDMMLDFDFE